MSIASEIQRLQGVKSDILEAIAAKGVTVPAGSALADCPELIGSIGGGGDFIKIGSNVYPYKLMPDGKKWITKNLELEFPTLIIGASGQSSSEPRANYYQNNQSLYSINGSRPLGLLYNKKAVDYLVNNPSVIAGCHVPTGTEWQNLIDAVGGDSVAGKKLKSVNDPLGVWPTNWNGTDDYGFSANPGGRYDGTFGFGGGRTFFRGAAGGYMVIRYDVDFVERFGGNDGYGYSVRLIVD